MKLTSITSALLVLFVSGARAADGDLDAACRTTSPVCTDPNASCQSSLCKCNPSFVKKGSACVPVVFKPCGKGQCLTYGACTNSLCACDTANGFAAGTSGDASCNCPNTKSMWSDGVCYLKNGETCSAASDCYPASGKICETTTCKCDTTKGWAAATAGQTSCSCDTTKAAALAVNGKCLLKVDQPCSATSDCIATDGMVCGTGSGSTKCTCDTSKAYAAGSAGDVTCSCPSGTHFKKADKSCGKVIDQTCATASECIDHTTCTNDGGTFKCKCDTASNFAVGSAAATSCACASNYEAKADGSCGKVIDQTCTTSSQCIDNAVCITDGGTLKCKCDTTKNFAAGTTGATSCTCDASKAVSIPVGGVCPLKVGQACTAATDCVAVTGMTCGSVSGTNKCTCDTTKNFLAGSNGDSTCSCDTAKAASTPNSSGYCALKVGQACTAATDCIAVTGMMCASVGGTNKCTCDTTKNFLAGSNGDFTCSCDTAKAANTPNSSGYCPLKVNQVCTAVTNCISTVGMVCADRSGTVKCTCDTSKHYAAGSDGAATCSCAANHAMKMDNTCGLIIGQNCSASGTPCIDDAICDPLTLKCTCDTGNGYAAGTTGDNSCSCQSTYVSTAWGCGKKVGQACSATCSDYASCNSTSGVCECSSGAVLETETSTCKNGGETLVSALVTLAAGLLIALCRM